MLRMTSLMLLAAPLLFACGISKEEHEKLRQQALDEQKATFDAEMKKMREAHDGELASRDKTLEDKDVAIDRLGSEVKKLGGDLQKVQGELGDRATQLASTKTQLAATTAELEQLRKLREEAEREAAQFRSIAQRLKAMIDSGQLEVVMRKGRINLKLPDDVLFPSGSEKLKKVGDDALRSVAEVLKDVDRDFLIAGHTDNVPLKKGGRFKDNWALSTARAVEVVQLLIREGVEPQRLAAAGFGEFDPIAENGTTEGKQKNRRLEIILLPKLEDVKL